MMLKLEELVRAILNNDLLEARQWVADAQRSGVRFASLPAPSLQSDRERALAAGVVELLAARGEQAPPAWANEIGSLSEPFFVGTRLREMRRSAEDAKLNGPEPLRRRNIFASPNFLTIR
jgi:hypothetical protein